MRWVQGCVRQNELGSGRPDNYKRMRKPFQGKVLASLEESLHYSPGGRRDPRLSQELFLFPRQGKICSRRDDRERLAARIHPLPRAGTS